jgi:hypothetical protein
MATLKLLTLWKKSISIPLYVASQDYHYNREIILPESIIIYGDNPYKFQEKRVLELSSKGVSILSK